jgi:hypothetical protein
MRLPLAVLAALLAAPTFAAESIADQASQAYAIFAGGKSQVDFLTARYGTTALADISGGWVNLNGPAPGTGVETYGADTARACKGAAVLTLASSDPMTLTLTAKPGLAEFKQTYTLVSGATFSQYTEPAQYFAAIGLGPDKRGEHFDQQRAVALSLANGIVQFYRPSADILVITRDGAYPNVLARCPKS